MIQFLSGLAENSGISSGLKMSQSNASPVDTKPDIRKQSNGSSTSSSNNNNNNGHYVDLGKALLEASKTGSADKVQECIKNGAPFITDWLGTSALHIAAKNNFYDTCATLLRSGISKDAKTKVDRTPLHFAVFEGNFEICQLLLEHSCSVDPLDMLKMSPLHWAVEKGFDNIAELLIENGANPHIVSKFLKTPYMIAKEKNNDFIINLIEMLPTTPCTPLSSSFDSSVFTKSIPHVKEESRQEPSTPRLPIKRERFHSYDSADTKRLRASPSDAKNFTLQLLKEQMNMMSNVEDNLIQSAISSGRRLMLSEAGKRLLNDSNLNSFLKIPLNTTISSTSPASTSRKSLSPRSATTTSRRTSDSSDVLEIFRESGIKANNDILNIIRSSSASSDLLQEVTITQRSLKNTPVSSPIQKTGISLSAINVPKAKAQYVAKLTKTQLPSSSSPSVSSLTTTNTTLAETNSSDYRLSKGHANADEDISKPDVIGRKYSELLNNYQQLRRVLEREQQKSDALQRQVTQLHTNFELYKRQQQLKFDSILTLIQGEHKKNFSNKKDDDNDEDVEEVL